jgi:acyl-CoA synthetase (AMP-forming)/AMP-acid ligase II
MDGGHLGLPVTAGDLTHGRFIAQVAERYPANEALVFGDRRLTYAQLHDEVRAFGKGLLALGVTKGAKVAVMLGNRPEFVVAAYGSALVGAVAVPVSTLAAADERDYILGHCDAAVLVTQASLLDRRFVDELVADHPGIGDAEPGRISVAAFPHLRRVVCVGAPSGRPSVEGWDDVVAAGAAVADDVLDAAAASVVPSDDALIIYTSGTTAHPKAVLHRHRGPVVQSWRWREQLALDPSDRVWSPFPFFWTAGLAFVLGGTLASGACFVCQEAFDPGEALELLERERITTVHTFPHSAAALVEHEDAPKRDLSSLRRVAQDSALRRLARIEGDPGDPRAAYGLTETFTICTSIPSNSPIELRETTHGVTLPGMAIRIVDPDSGEPLGMGETGEIAVRGVTLMRGYYKVDPEECFDEDGWFRTKDSGHVDEAGYLHWHGRLSGLIKTAGANVSPAEVEAAVANWGRLKLGSVVGVPHPRFGEAVVLCAVRSLDPVSAEDITGHLRGVLASYKVPRRVLFFDDEELTYTGSQKVRLEDLRSLAARRVAEGDDDWASFLREQHAELIAAPAGD